VNLSRCSIGIWDDNERVDLEVCELAVNVDGVQSGNEVDEDIVYTLWYLLEERSSNLFV